MAFLAISSKSIPRASKNDFGAEVKGSSLLVPQDLAITLDRLSVRTAEEFVSYLYDFPGTVAELLKWSVQDVIHARATLISRLHGFVDEKVLDPPEVPRRTYGARF